MFHSKYHEHHKLAFRWILIGGAAIIAIGLAVIVLFVDRPVVTPVDVEQEDEFYENLPLTQEDQRSAIERLQLAEENLPPEERVTDENMQSMVQRLEQVDMVEDDEVFEPDEPFVPSSLPEVNLDEDGEGSDISVSVSEEVLNLDLTIEDDSDFNYSDLVFPDESQIIVEDGGFDAE